MTLFTNLRTAVRKRAAYRRTVNELNAIPAHLAEDIGIFPGQAERLAHEAVYN